MKKIRFEAYEWDFKEWDDDMIYVDIKRDESNSCYMTLSRDEAELMLKELQKVLGK